MPFSYAQYAGNGSTTTFSVPFPYLLKAHVKLYTGYNILDSTFATELAEGTDFTWTSDVQVQTTVAIATGVTLTILRDTPDGALLVPWQDGSNLIADDLRSSDLQNLYVVQEQQDRNAASAAASAAATAAASAAAASAASAATTATEAAASATTAAASATTAASAATEAAGTATTTANTALTRSDTALTQSASATSTANTAATNATNAVTTANSASTQAAAAVLTANTALDAVSEALNYASVANVASIPSAPLNGDAVRVLDTSGIQSFTPLSGLPAGFNGSAALTAELRYDAAASAWLWIRYYATDPEARYLSLTGGTMSGPIQFAIGQPFPNTLAPDAIGDTVQPYNAGNLTTENFATQAEAEAGVDNQTVMTPQRTLQAIKANPTGVSLGIVIALS